MKYSENNMNITITVNEHPRSKVLKYTGNIGGYRKTGNVSDFESELAFKDYIIKDFQANPPKERKKKISKKIKDVEQKPHQRNPLDKEYFLGRGDYIGQEFFRVKELNGYLIYQWQPIGNPTSKTWDVFPKSMRYYPTAEDFPNKATFHKSLANAEEFIMRVSTI